MDQKESQQKPQDEALSRDALARQFGESLRQSREAAGYSIDRAAVSTKISISFIQALEEGELARLPGAVFARGFIRNLCKIYQADAASFLDAFEKATDLTPVVQEAPSETMVAQVAEPSDPEAVPSAEEKMSKTQECKADVQRISKEASENFRQQVAVFREKLAVYLPLLSAQRNQLMVGAAVGAVLISVLLFFVTDPATQAPDQAALQPQPSEMPVVMEEQPPAPQIEHEEKAGEVVSPVAQEEVIVPKSTATKDNVEEVANPVEKVATSVDANPAVSPPSEVKATPVKPTVPKVEKAPVAAATPSVPVGTRQSLEIFARQRVVVRLTKDGGAPQNITLEPKQHSFEFRDEAQVLIFDASVVDVKFNGRSLGPLGKSGRVRRLSFKREELPVHAKM